MSVADELEANPQLAEEILSMAGQMSMAYCVAKTREVFLQNQELERNVTHWAKECRQLRRELEQLKEHCRQLQTKQNRRMDTMQNQLNGSFTDAK